MGLFRDLLIHVGQVYALSIIHTSLGWFITENILSANIAKRIPVLLDDVIVKLAKRSNVMVHAFHIPEELLLAPMAKDWVEYNQHNNQGIVINASKVYILYSIFR
jgi:acyl-CoA oxidase